ncbi:hypothetical protein EGW08_002503, partial [Elysia chlorotica]
MLLFGLCWSNILISECTIHECPMTVYDILVHALPCHFNDINKSTCRNQRRLEKLKCTVCFVAGRAEAALLSLGFPASWCASPHLETRCNYCNQLSKLPEFIGCPHLNI